AVGGRERRVGGARDDPRVGLLRRRYPSGAYVALVGDEPASGMARRRSGSAVRIVCRRDEPVAAALRGFRGDQRGAGTVLRAGAGAGAVLRIRVRRREVTLTCSGR